MGNVLHIIVLVMFGMFMHVNALLFGECPYYLSRLQEHHNSGRQVHNPAIAIAANIRKGDSVKACSL